MTRRRIVKILAIVGVTFIAVITAGAFYLAHANRQSAIKAATTWARLAPLPSSAKNVQVDVKGSMFSREFVITFDGPSPVIQQWLATSPGPSSATQSSTGAITTYSITPGGGAQFAEVKVDWTENRVVIRAFAS